MADSGGKTRVVTDSMLGLHMKDIDAWSPRVTVVLGQNPGAFTGPGTNTYLIGTGRRPLLLDTGQGVPAYLPLLEQAVSERNADGLQEIVLTHVHPDHVGGVPAIQQRFGPLPVAKKPWPGRDIGFDSTAIEDGAVVSTDGATLRAIFTPGHARDHLCFYLEEERALFTGDVVLGAGTTVIGDDGDLIDYLDSLRRLLTLDVAVIYPAHGPAIRNPREKIEQYIAHRLLREEQVVAGLRAGVTDAPALVKRMYTDVPEFLHTAAAMSVTSHLRKLEKEGRVTQADGAWHLS
ncbi:MAG: beta-lactamase-like protein 2 [Deltaproteobacteria bacterium]|nr:beta-lactamase-like protein 2 [Deltaproteobacteria bacterium]MBI3390966.1 beta-lactamase-like protein 2 [Deltaproteobacteria bacterium]